MNTIVSKKCPRCLELKDASQYYKSKGELSSYCKACMIAYQMGEYHERRNAIRKESDKNYREKNRELLRRRGALAAENYKESRRKWRDNNRALIRSIVLKTKYGITLEDYENMMKEQNGVCAICGGINNGKNLHVDHCHKTGVVRGLLCAGCNKALGMIGDKPKVALNMYKYLNK